MSDYALAVLAVAAAFAIQQAFRDLMVETPFLLFFGAIMISAWRGGLGPGLLATALSAAIALFYFIPPFYRIKLTTGREAIKLVVFLAEGALISVLAHQLRQASRLARRREGERGEADAARSRTQDQLRIIADSLPALVSYIDTDRRYRFANRAYERWFKLPAGSVAGRSMREVLGDAAYERVRPHLDAAMAGRTVSYEASLPYSSGGTRFVQAQYVPDVAPDGSVRGVVALVTDLTDRKRDEDANRFLSETGKVLAASLDYRATLERLVELAVPAIADWCMLDLFDADGALARVAVAHRDPEKRRLAFELARLYPPQDNDRQAQVMASGKPMLFPEITDEVIRGSGRPQEFVKRVRSFDPRSGMLVPLVARGRTLGTIAFTTTGDSGRTFDDADLRLAEELARRAALAVDNARLYADAQEANRTKDQFLATVSHELRTPLNAILGWAQLLQMGGIDRADAPRGLETIERNARAQAQIIDDLLDVSRIITGKLRLDVKPTDVRPAVEAAIESVRHAATAKNILLEARFDPAGAPVRADAARLQQVLWNLLSNAIKFTPPGGRVEVSVAREGDSGGIEQAVITVADTGPGIDGGFLPHVFDRFRQADAGTTRKHGGLGIGLSIVRHLTELHGGTVDAGNRAAPHTGAVFHIRLPLAPAATDAPIARGGGNGDGDRGDGPRDDDGSGTVRLDGIRVLVVDDEPDTLDLISRVLRRSNADVTIARSAAEAMSHLARAKPDVLLSDIAMPGEDGFELIRRVRALDPHGRDLPAAALTAFARDDDRARALSAGFHVHLPKPVEPAALTAVVAELAGRRA